MNKFTMFALLASGAVQTAYAQQVTTLSAARTAGPGATVTVRGVVLNGPELGFVRYVQDKDAGLAAFSNKLPGFSDLVPGDSVEISGTLKNYNSLLEMDPVLSVKKLASKRPLRPVVVPATSLSSVYNEANEGRLVKITGVKKLNSTSGAPATTLAGNTNYLLDGQAGATVRISATSTGEKGLIDKEVPKTQFDILGIIG
jgi:hypothetical protein